MISVRAPSPDHYLVEADRVSRHVRSVMKYLGGSDVSYGVWKFPRVFWVLSQLLGYFGEEDVQISEEIYPVDQPWGFPEISFDGGQHPRWADLDPYQQRSVGYLLSSPYKGSLLALSPGLGKTPVAVVAGQLLGAGGICVSCPLSLLGTWRTHLEEWGGVTPAVLHGPEQVPEEGWVVTNFETLTRNSPLYQRRWDLLIIDESLAVKNRKTKRWKTYKKVLLPRTKKIWLLSGNPTSKYVDDLWAQLYLTHPKAFKSYWRFVGLYCTTEDTLWGTEVTGSQDIDFRREFKDVMLSIDQSEVLDLPEHIFEVLDLELTPRQEKVYSDLLDNFVTHLESGTITAPNRMAQIIRLMQSVSGLANLGETGDSCKVDTIQELLELNHWEFPMIIWVHFQENAEYLHRQLADKFPNLRIQIALGGEPHRDQIFEDFVNGRLDIMILSLGVGKYGLTFTNARSAVYLDRTFDGDAWYQSLLRIRRRGLKHSPLVTILRVPGTTDNLVEDNLVGKMKDISKITNADLIQLLRSLGRVS